MRKPKENQVVSYVDVIEYIMASVEEAHSVGELLVVVLLNDDGVL